jgi:hypothetical protein
MTHVTAIQSFEYKELLYLWWELEIDIHVDNILHTLIYYNLAFAYL